jgi:hypothetical protein
MAARLEALENDAAVQDTFAAGSDDEEFVLRDESEGGNFSSSLSIVVTCWVILLLFLISNLPFSLSILNIYRRRTNYRL